MAFNRLPEPEAMQPYVTAMQSSAVAIMARYMGSSSVA